MLQKRWEQSKLKLTSPEASDVGIVRVFSRFKYRVRVYLYPVPSAPSGLRH